MSPSLEALVLKMLAKNADDRFQTMHEVREALNAEITRAPTYRPGDTAPPVAQPRRYSSSATTLSAAASVTAGTVPPRNGQRRALRIGAVTAGVAAGIVFGVLRHGSSSAPPSKESSPVAAVTSPPALVVPTPAPAVPAPAPVHAATPAAPSTVEVVLDSSPQGASVDADGIAIGTTPMKWQVAPSGDPRTLTFKLAGYRQEVVKTVPASGLRLRPTLEHLRHGRPRHGSSASARPGAGPIEDIKTER